MDRKLRILQQINLAGNGLEIGASFNPILPKKEGFNVKTLDYESEEELRERFKDWLPLGYDSSKIEPVDFVWKGGKYSELVKGEKFDWIIASHVIEHTPDMIGFINECHSILTENGVLALAIPDKRYTLDYFRMPSSLGQIIDAHNLGKKQPSLGDILDCHFLSVFRGNNIPPLEQIFKSLDFERSPTVEDYKTYSRKAGYTDSHVWVFTPNHFRMLVEDLNKLGLIKLRENVFCSSRGNEFYMFLTDKGIGPMKTRYELARQANKEIVVRFGVNAGRGKGWIKGIISFYDKLYCHGFLKKTYQKLKKSLGLNHE